MQDKLVSVVIPTYNHAHFLKKCLGSVIGQTYSNWEAIVVNNFSDDNTVDVVAGFKDPRIKLIHFRNHGVIAASRNKGINLSLGSHVAFLDADDVWYPYKLEKCMNVFYKNSDIDIVCHNELHRDLNDNSLTTGIYGPYQEPFFERLLLKGNCVSTSATVVTKKALQDVGGFNESIGYVTVEDYALWLDLSRTYKFYFLNEILGEYVLHGSNCSSKIELHTDNVISVICDNYRKFINKNLLNRFLLRIRLLKVQKDLFIYYFYKLKILTIFIRVFKACS